MKVLVVDDEEPARRRLIRLWRDIPGAEVVGEAGDGEEALRQVETLHPELMLLDIRMPGLDGLSLAQRYADLPPLIFITAYDEYAVQSFEVSAVDYLLKPVRPERLKAAMERARQRLLATKEAAARALEVVASREGPSTRLAHHEAYPRSSSPLLLRRRMRRLGIPAAPGGATRAPRW